MVVIVIVTVALSAAGGVAVLAYLSPERPRRESFRPRGSRRGRRPSAAERAVPYELTLGALFAGAPREGPAEIDWERASSADWSLEPVDLVLYPEPSASAEHDPGTEPDDTAADGVSADEPVRDDDIPSDDDLPSDELAPDGEPASDEPIPGEEPDDALVPDEEPERDVLASDDALQPDDGPGPDGLDAPVPDEDLEDLTAAEGPGSNSLDQALDGPSAAETEPAPEASVEPEAAPDREPVRTS